MRKINIISWGDAKDCVSNVDPILANIIDDLGINNAYKLIKASYLYGDLIIDHGLTNVPNNGGKLASISGSDLPKTIKEKLSYQSIPLFLTLKNDNEVFIDTDKRSIPLNLFHQGSLLGVFEAIDFLLGRKSNPRWCVSAGARSIFMLPKITDVAGLNKLRLYYNINKDIHLQGLQDHWELFTAIATSKNFKQPWQNEVLFFTSDWLKHYDDPKWLKFYHYLHSKAWQQVQFSVGKVEHSLIWENFAEAFAAKNLKPRPFLADHVKHILAITTRKSPAFHSVDNNQKIAPVKGLQEAFIKVYDLKKYVPTMMSINSLQDMELNTIYYSLSYPTLLEGSPIDRASSTIMLDFRKIKQLFEALKKYAKKHTLIAAPIIENLDLEFFHVESDQFGEITSSTRIFDKDNDFILGQKAFPDRIFCDTSLFWRGCVKIKVLS